MGQSWRQISYYHLLHLILRCLLCQLSAVLLVRVAFECHFGVKPCVGKEGIVAKDAVSGQLCSILLLALDTCVDHPHILLFASSMASNAGHRPTLTNDLWAKVLSNLNPESRSSLSRGLNGATLVGGHQQFYCLRFVCKQLNEVFKQHPELSSCTYLCRSYSQQATSSLSTWLRHHSHLVSTFVADCDSLCVEAALAALKNSAPCLATVIIYKASSVGVGILSTFSSLTRCELSAPDNSTLDLSALKALGGLKDLRLYEGRANVMCAQEWMSIDKLQQLNMLKSEISGAHTLGLRALTALRRFDCDCSAITATSFVDELDISRVSAPVIPPNIFALVHLTCLKLTFPCIVDTTHLDALFGLGNLEELRLIFENAAVIELSSKLSHLKRLRVLDIVLFYDRQARLILTVPWHELHCLRTVELYATEMQMDQDMLGLTQLRYLQLFGLSNRKLVDYESVRWFGVLMYHMALESPYVVCQVNLNQSVCEAMAEFKHNIQ